MVLRQAEGGFDREAQIGFAGGHRKQQPATTNPKGNIAEIKSRWPEGECGFRLAADTHYRMLPPHSRPSLPMNYSPGISAGLRPRGF